MKRREDLTLPRAPRSRSLLDVTYDPEVFGRFAETIARFLGTARYLVFQTVVIVVWIAVNTVPGLTFDDYPFILLTLALSMQASYAAPLILLAQNRQERRDRELSERDRQLQARTQEDAEYILRELAEIRLLLTDVVTQEDLREHLRRVTDALDRVQPAEPD